MTEQQDAGLAIEQVILGGNLALLTPVQRLRYYKLLCESLGLNHLTRPFEYITVQGKLILYARRDATDQLRKVHDIAIEIVARERYEDVWVVTARARTPTGRTDEAVGAVSLVGLKGMELANALMKAETKAKRRVTLSIVGLGWTDETEVTDIIGAINHAKEVKTIAPARKFADLSEEEKRERLEKGWNQRRVALNARGVNLKNLPLPDFKTSPIEDLIVAAAILADLEKQAKENTEGETIEGLATKIRTLLNLESQEENTSGDYQPSPES